MTNETGQIDPREHRVLVHGTGELAHVVAKKFLERGAQVAVRADIEGCVALESEGNKSIVSEAAEKLGGLSILANVCLPTPEQGIDFVKAYPESLYSRCSAAIEALLSVEGSPAIINHCALPAMYVGTCLEDQMAILRGAITGLTRTFARKYGKQALRVTAVQTGLVELADDAWVSDVVRTCRSPYKDGHRWRKWLDSWRFWPSTAPTPPAKP